MQTQSIQYSRPIIPTLFKGVSRDDLEWTINYLLTLLEMPEINREESEKDICNEEFSPRINRLLSIPKLEISSVAVHRHALSSLRGICKSGISDEQALDEYLSKKY